MQMFSNTDVPRAASPLADVPVTPALAVLFDAVAKRAGVTFRYTERGPQGLLPAVKLWQADAVHYEGDTGIALRHQDQPHGWRDPRPRRSRRAPRSRKPWSERSGIEPLYSHRHLPRHARVAFR
jgi:hypothetical protein